MKTMKRKSAQPVILPPIEQGENGCDLPRFYPELRGDAWCVIDRETGTATRFERRVDAITRAAFWSGASMLQPVPAVVPEWLPDPPPESP